MDATIASILPYLEKGDIIVDGGNSHFPDSDRRAKELASQGILFVGSGVSGGEEGALNGPSISMTILPPLQKYQKLIFDK